MYEVLLSERARRFFETATADLQRRLDRCFEQIGVTYTIDNLWR